jgi:putative ABC transport system substrate-binding protein
MRRREFIAGLAAAAAMPAATGAQQREPVRRIGILLPASPEDLDYQAWLGAFLQELQQSGWAIGRNLRIDTRWATTNPTLLRKHATELAASAPDVVLAHGVSGSTAMLHATRTIPIVFPVIGDPVGAGFVESLSRPGGNITGFMTFEYSVAGKWLGLLKQIAPDLKRAAVLRDPTLATGIAHFGVMQAMAPSLGVEVTPINLRTAGEIERALTTFAREPHGGAIMIPSGLASVHRALILKLASQHRLPVVWFERNFVTAGGLVSYGPDFIDQFRRAAGYVDRILKGEKPADLPVQAPTKYQLVINLKTAKALGVTVPPALLTLADEVME